ncbi:MAG: PilZ domain-containing protein [Myxococcota bacterium]
MERRCSKRTRIDLMINKYIDGYPYACRAVDISQGGVLVERIREPKHDRKFYPVEIGIPGATDRVWAWARQVRTEGRRQALRFVAMDPFDQLLLDQYIANRPR